MATNVDIATLTAKLALDAKNFNAGIDTATQKLGAVTKDNAWSKLGESLNSVAKVATVTGGAIVGMAGITVKAATDFESAFTGVKKTINFEGTQAEADAFFENIRNNILELSTKLPVTAEEIAGVYEAAGQLGIQNENLDIFAESMLGIGSATNIASQEAAVAFAQFANVTGMAQTEFPNLSSALVELGNNTATDERSIMNMATELANLAKQCGWSEGTILGVSAALSSVGLDAAASGSSMQRITMDITAAVATMSNTSTEQVKMFTESFSLSGKALDEYAKKFGYTTKDFKAARDDYVKGITKLNTYAELSGMSAEQFALVWKNNSYEAFNSILYGLKQLEPEKQLDVLKRLEIQNTRDIDLLQRLAGAADLVQDSVVMANKAWEKNEALTNEVEKRNADVASQLQMLKNDLSALAIEAGTALLPIVRELLEQAKPLIEKATEWIKNNPEAVVQLTKTGAALLAIGTAVSGVINVVTAIGSFITTVKTLGGAISILTGGGAAAGAAAGGGGLLAGLGAGIAAIGPVVLGIGAIVGGFALAWKNDWLGCKTHMSEAVETDG